MACIVSSCTGIFLRCSKLWVWMLKNSLCWKKWFALCFVKKKRCARCAQVRTHFRDIESQRDASKKSVWCYSFWKMVAEWSSKEKVWTLCIKATSTLQNLSPLVGKIALGRFGSSLGYNKNWAFELCVDLNICRDFHLDWISSNFIINSKICPAKLAELNLSNQPGNWSRKAKRFSTTISLLI